jgi:hypothetical protein
MPKDITIVISSREEGEDNQELIGQIQNTCGTTAHVILVTNDGDMGLSQLYSQMLFNPNIESKIVVFCHDDIEFLKPDWGKEIVRLFNKHRDYGIIGVAGSAEFDENGAWWNYKKKYGQVLHKHDGKSWLTTFSPLLKKDLQQVCVIDGLFMAFHKERVSKNFDPKLPGFNMYDIDVCLANFFDGKCKIGVTTNIRLAHKSIGELSSEWFENRNRINEKYGKYFPIKI